MSKASRARLSVSDSTGHGDHVIAVHPGMLERLDLGKFPSEREIPEYQFDLVPDLQDAMGIHQLRVETGTGIHVVYHFQNYGMQTIEVHPRKKVGGR